MNVHICKITRRSEIQRMIEQMTPPNAGAKQAPHLRFRPSRVRCILVELKVALLPSQVKASPQKTLLLNSFWQTPASECWPTALRQPQKSVSNGPQLLGHCLRPVVIMHLRPNMINCQSSVHERWWRPLTKKLLAVQSLRYSEY